MLKGLVLLLLAVSAFVVSEPAFAQKKDCMTWCQTVRCTRENMGSGNAGYCMERCTAACNAQKK